MENLTATEVMLRYNRRAGRARSVAYHIMHAVAPYLDPNNPDAYTSAGAALTKLLEEEGAEIITDRDRADAGLPPRDNSGWTHDELEALERFRLRLHTGVIRPLEYPNEE